jgi:hypothetical protein
MATYSGRYGQITLNADTTEETIQELNTWSLNTTAGTTDTSSFGDVWGKSNVGILNWNGTASGFYDPEQTTQQQIWNRLVDGGLMGYLWLYTLWSETSGDKLLYWKPDLISDPNAGARITGFNTGQTSGGVGTFDFSFDGSGPIIPVSTTVP